MAFHVDAIFKYITAGCAPSCLTALVPFVPAWEEAWEGTFSNHRKLAGLNKCHQAVGPTADLSEPEPCLSQTNLSSAENHILIPLLLLQGMSLMFLAIYFPAVEPCKQVHAAGAAVVFDCPLHLLCSP